MPQLPRIHSKRERESPIADIRVEKGLFLRELVQLSGVTYGTINKLTTGELSPIQEIGSSKGSPKETAMKIADALDVDFGELFPRYVCDLRRNTDYTADQLLEASGLYKFPSPEEEYERKAFWESVKHYMKIFGIPKRNIDIFIHLVVWEYTLSETAEKFKISKERVRQITRKVVNRFRFATEPE